MEGALLPRFIKYLESENLVEFDIIGEGDHHFWNRFRIQKYMFLAKYFGLETPYKHGINLYGPYSGTLTDDYYGLARDPERYRKARPELPRQFRSGQFLDFVRGRGDGWLEVSTTLLSKRKRIPQRDVLLQNTKKTKIGFTRGFIEETLRGLEEAGLLECER